ncbi:integrase catalytic subunit [Alicycliphilus sp. B1]|nr:integrase catalytic subunit [Alicycliphilus sp. B1]
MAELEDFQQPGSRHDLRADVGQLRVLGPSCSMLSVAKVVGWAMGEQMTAALVVSALTMALHTRKPESVIHHSD